MNMHADNETRIDLAGDWTMSGVAERFPPLSRYFCGLVDSHATGEQPLRPTDPTAEIDLAGVTSLDACGCQLLALLLGNLSRNGIHAQLINLPEACRATIQSLGFERALHLSP